MKNSILKFALQIALAGVCTLSLSPALANPQPDDKTLLASVPCVGIEDCLADGYGVSLRSILFLPTYKQAHSMLAGSILSIILMPPSVTSLSLDSNLSQGIMSLISNKGDALDKLLANTPEIFAPGIVLTPEIKTKPSEAEQQSALNTLNFDSVITPTTYSKVNVGNADSNKDSDKVNQPLIANTFIQYVTGLANPMRASDFSSAILPPNSTYSSLPAYIADLQKKPEVKDYLAGLRTYTAQVSVGLSNFYYLYNERMPIQDPKVLEKALMLTKQPGPQGAPADAGPISALQVQHILATRRVNDPSWYIAMQNAVPSTLLRETLFLLAEIPPMLFQLHLDLERILATMSTMQIQQANGNILMLEQKRDKVDSILSTPTKPPSETAAAASSASTAVDDAELEQAKKAIKTP